MRIAMPIMTATLLCIAAATAADAPFDHLQIDTKACALVHSGSMNKDVLWRGKNQMGLCSVKVPLAEFQKRYSVCALAGVLATKGSAMCEFGYSNKDKTEIFFLSDDKTLCEFVCTAKQ
jgi:hypothetical protein